MARSRARIAAILLTAALLIAPVSRAAPPDYKLGDIATDDVITPVPLLVVNPEATEALKQNVAKQSPFIIRHNPRGAAEAEAELRAVIAAARKKFLERLQEQLLGRTPTEADIGSPAFTRAVADVARESPKDTPFDRLAPLWVRGESDEPFVKSLVQPVRDVLAQVIVDNKTETPLPANQPLRLVTVRSLSMPPGVRDLDAPGTPITAGKITGLWRARRLVETGFAADQASLARFAASFVRPNALPDPAATELLRTRSLEGVTANDAYEAAQTIVRKGQTIDRKALAALSALREKSLIGSLQSQLEQTRQNTAAPIPDAARNPIVWIAVALGGVFLALLAIFWKLRTRPATSLAPVLMPGAPRNSALSLGDVASDEWRQRALLAEAKAERAHQAIRTGVLGWMKEKIVSTLFRQRSDLLAVQQKAEAEMRELEQRLEQLHAPLQQRIAAYEKRIEELEAGLVAKGEENRHLLHARLTVARQQLERSRFQSN